MTEFKAGDESLKQIPTEDLCLEAKGVAACLLKTWTTKVQWEPQQPLVLVFPGACSGSLRRMGAAASRVTEHEITSLEPSVELCVELDKRWSSQAVIGAIEKDPREGL